MTGTRKDCDRLRPQLEFILSLLFGHNFQTLLQHTTPSALLDCLHDAEIMRMCAAHDIRVVAKISRQNWHAQQPKVAKSNAAAGSWPTMRLDGN